MTYLEMLLSSRLPVAPWVVIAAWLALFVANHVVGKAVRTTNARHSWYAVEGSEALSRALRPPWMLLQMLFAASIFAFCLYAGGAMFVFLAAGLDVSLICVLGMNVDGLLSSRAMQTAGAVDGTAKFSADYMYRRLASRLAGAALTCGLLGLLLAHLALLGGALLCASMASGYWRRARGH